VRVHHDANMSWPGDQVARLGVHDGAKFRNAAVEIGRADVGVRKAGTLIDGVHEMRAIGLGVGGLRDSSAALITDRPSLELSSGEGLCTARRVRGAVGGLAWFACPANAGGTRTQSRSSAGCVFCRAWLLLY